MYTKTLTEEMQESALEEIQGIKDIDTYRFDFLHTIFASLLSSVVEDSIDPYLFKVGKKAGNFLYNTVPTALSAVDRVLTENYNMFMVNSGPGILDVDNSFKIYVFSTEEELEIFKWKKPSCFTCKKAATARLDWLNV